METSPPIAIQPGRADGPPLPGRRSSQTHAPSPGGRALPTPEVALSRQRFAPGPMGFQPPVEAGCGTLFHPAERSLALSFEFR